MVGPTVGVGAGLKSGDHVEFKYVDTGAEKITKALKDLARLSLWVGFQGQTALKLYERRTINVATVALYNEFGTRNMPARGFMRRSVAKHARGLEAVVAKKTGEVVALKVTPIEAVYAIGKFMAERMVDEINTAESWAVPLAPSTIASKVHSDPLIETELMRNSITWTVRLGSAVVAQGQVA